MHADLKIRVYVPRRSTIASREISKTLIGKELRYKDEGSSSGLEHSSSSSAASKVQHREISSLKPYSNLTSPPYTKTSNFKMGLGFKASHLWEAPEVNPVNKKARSIVSSF